MKKILIVDDEEYIRELVAATLSGSPYELLMAKDGEEALEIARKERPDLILLDIEMPKKDGYEVCRALKGDPETSDITIIILTAHAQKEDIRKGYKAGADEYFIKPFSPTALLRKVEEALG